MTNDQLIDQYRDALIAAWQASQAVTPTHPSGYRARLTEARHALLAAMTKRTDPKPAERVDALMALVDQYAYNYKGNFDGGARDRVERALNAALVKR